MQDKSQHPQSPQYHPALRARILARPARQIEGVVPTGLLPLELDNARDGLLYVPKSYQADRPAPLVLMLHGAGGTARGGLAPFLEEAEASSFLLLAPESRGETWDVIMDGYGPDVVFIEQALTQMFHRYVIDPQHLAVEGFSDGASYALSLGLANGDLFSHIIAFSPGFMAAPDHVGRPRIYVSHGVHDPVLPIKRCSQRLVPRLRSMGYDVRYHEFEGSHAVPERIVREAARWFVQR